MERSRKREGVIGMAIYDIEARLILFFIFMMAFVGVPFSIVVFLSNIKKKGRNDNPEKQKKDDV